MNRDIDISVLVVTYNPDWIKLKNTLSSILIQKDVKFEIIISDDGSVDNNFDKIVLYFREKSFENYKLIGGETNQGTVKNLIKGLEKVQGKYVKDISPGDLLYDENTLRFIVEETKKNEEIIYFGNAIYYSFENGDLQIYNVRNPRNVNIYKNKQNKKIQRNYLLRQDYILGASFVVQTRIFLDYLLKIENYVIYAEDCAFICMIADGIFPSYMDNDIIWYEYGSGISTSKESSWNKKILADNKATFDLLRKEKIIPNYAYEINYSSSKIKRKVLSMIFDFSRVISKFHVNKSILSTRNLNQYEEDILKYLNGVV